MFIGEYMTLQELLQTKVPAKDKDGNEIFITPSFRVAVQGELSGGIHFIVHADGHDSETLDFVVDGDELIPLAVGTAV